MTLRDTHLLRGAKLAPDGIPLHYGDLAAEYNNAHTTAILLDRSHEGRIKLTGETHFELLNRMSTNKLVDMMPGEGRPSIFINDNARIIDRVVVYNLLDHMLAITEPGQNLTIMAFLQRHIFYGDNVQTEDLTSKTAQFAIHGPQATIIAQMLHPDAGTAPHQTAYETTLDNHRITLLQRKPIIDAHWIVICDIEDAPQVYESLLALGLSPAGSLTYNTLRIKAGRPARPELSGDYIPLEIGLYDEISFNKGCYTGQEIIARMDSRERIARVMVKLTLDKPVQTPADVLLEGRVVGKVTSSVQAPDNTIFALAIVKVAAATQGSRLTVGEATATVNGYAGTPPPFLKPEQTSVS